MAGVVVEMSADDAKLHRAIAKLERQQLQFQRKLKATGTTGRKAGADIGRSMDKAGKDAFGPQALTRIKNYATAIVGVGAGIALVTKAFGEMSRVREAAAARNRAAEIGLGALTQLSGGDPKRLAELIGQAKGIFSGGGAATKGEAGSILFSLVSAGAGGPDARKLFADLYGIEQDPAGLARGAATLRTSIGVQETGSIRQIVSKAFAASEFSPAQAAPLLEAAARGGVSAKKLGIRDEALLAATAIAATATGSAELGGTQVESLLMSLVKRGGFAGLSLRESIGKISDLGLSDPELIKFLGRKEAASAFSTLRGNLPTFDKAIKAIDQAQASDLAGSLITARNLQPELAATLRERQARAGRELGEDPLGVKLQLARAEIDQFKERRRTEGADELITNLRAWAAQLLITLQQFGAVGPQVRPAGFGEQPEEFRAIEEAAASDSLVRLKEAADQAANALERVGGGPALMPAGVDQ